MPERPQHYGKIRQFLDSAKGKIFRRKPKGANSSQPNPAPEGNIDSGEKKLILGQDPKALLDLFHRRISELESRIHEPFFPTRPLEAKDIEVSAFGLLMDLSDSIKLWQVEEEIRGEKDRLIRNYFASLGGLEADSRKTFFQVQLVYTGQDKVPVYGNLAVIKPDPDLAGYLREHYFQAGLEERSHVIYVHHPYHHESEGKRLTNTEGAVIKARQLIADLPKTN